MSLVKEFGGGKVDELSRRIQAVGLISLVESSRGGRVWGETTRLGLGTTLVKLLDVALDLGL